MFNFSVFSLDFMTYFSQICQLSPNLCIFKLPITKTGCPHNFVQFQNWLCALFFLALKYVDHIIFGPSKNVWTGSFSILAKTLGWMNEWMSEWMDGYLTWMWNFRIVSLANILFLLETWAIGGHEMMAFITFRFFTRISQELQVEF